MDSNPSLLLALALNAALLAAMGFMLRHYFLRVEKHLERNHDVFTVLTQHELRIERVEFRLGLPPTPKPKAFSDAP